MTVNEISGYSLFREVLDRKIRIYNQARILKNMMQDFSDDKKQVKTKGLVALTTYMGAITMEDRADVHAQLEKMLKTKDVE